MTYMIIYIISQIICDILDNHPNNFTLDCKENDKKPFLWL